MDEDEKLNKLLKDTGNWEDALKALDENSLVVTTKEVAKAIPGAGTVVAAANAFLCNVLHKKVEANRRKLLESLKAASSNYTIHSVSKEDFIVDFMNLRDVTDRLRSNEKIQFMANLFVSTHCGENDDGLDEYDEMLERINRLSLREIKLLCLLRKYGETTEEFYGQASEEFSLDKEVINNMLSSMTQSGFCKEKVGAYVGYTGNVYYTTELYARFLQLIDVDDGLSEEDRKQRRKAGEDDVMSDVQEEDIQAMLSC